MFTPDTQGHDYLETEEVESDLASNLVLCRTSKSITTHATTEYKFVQSYWRLQEGTGEDLEGWYTSSWMAFPCNTLLHLFS